jgi:cytidine deaminase
MAGARPALAEAMELMGVGDRALATTALEVLDRVYRPGVHEVAAAALLADGAVVTGVHVESSQGRASVCAESAVVSAAAVRQSPIESLVAVLRRPDSGHYLIEPCGVCAELLADHHRQASVWVGEDAQARRVHVADLLRFRQPRPGRGELIRKGI